jgi:genome
MIALIGPWIISFGILVLIMLIVSDPWHPFFVFLYTFMIMSFIILPIYLIYSAFFSKNSLSSKECEINIKIDEISKKTESQEVIEKKESLEKQQAIWDAEIQQLTNENNERQENLVYINQEIAMLTSSMIPFLPKNIKNK